MNTLEYSINDNPEKKIEIDYKLPIRTKIFLGIFFALIIIFLIIIIIWSKINYNDLEESINQVNDDKKGIILYL